jgi:hypothetical protein
MRRADAQCQPRECELQGALVTSAMSEICWPKRTAASGRERDITMAAESCPLPARPSRRKSASRRGCELALPANGGGCDARHIADGDRTRSARKRRQRGRVDRVHLASMAVAGATALPAGGLPRIDHSYAEILEVPDVTRCERGSPGKRDARDLRIAHVHGPSGSLARRRQSRGLGCGGTVKIQDAILQILREEPVKRQLEQLPSPPSGQQRKSKTGFEQRDAGYPDRFGGLVIEPSYDLRLRRSAHERR